MSASSLSLAAISTLFKTSHLRSGRSFRPSRIFSTFGPAPARPSTINAIMSASPAPSHAAATIARSNLRCAAKIPGVSTKMICVSPASATPNIRVRVVCAFGLTIATFCPTRALTKVDFPAFGAPIMATCPHFLVMRWFPKRQVLQRFRRPVYCSRLQ